MSIYVLVITTDESIRAQIQQTASQHGFDVFEAQTLSDGIRQAADLLVNIVIISEYLLDGPLRAVVSRIRAVLPNAVIIMLEYTDAGVQAAKGLGVPFIAQPFDGFLFVSRLESQFKLAVDNLSVPPPQAAPPPTPARQEPARNQRDEAPSLWDKFGESLNNIKEDVKKALGGESEGRGGVPSRGRQDESDEVFRGPKAAKPEPPRQQPTPPQAPLDVDDEEPIYRGIPKGAFEEAEESAPPQFSRPPSSVPPPAPRPAPITRPTNGIPGAPPASQAPPTSRAEPPEPKPEAQPPANTLAAGHDVQFSAYYPREIKPMDWQPLIAYLFKQSAGPEVSTDAKKLLGDRTDIRTTQRPATQAIAEGATVMATPRLDGFQFNPPSISVGFFEDWHRFDFKLRAKDAPLDQAANGFVTFTVEGIIVADVPLSIFVTESVSAATQQAESLQKPYQAIFCSYSHKDTNIIERVERAYKALGMDYLRDVTTLKSGQEWNAELLKMIERADIFQLFWSSNSSMSKYVAQEYEHALNLKRPGPFVRPVYWEQPMPKVPDPLRPFHFAFEPTLDDDLPPAVTTT